MKISGSLSDDEAALPLQLTSNLTPPAANR
jgi:hypothetical protein